MILEGLVTAMFQGNCYIVGCEATRQAMIVDPGDEGSASYASSSASNSKPK